VVTQPCRWHVVRPACKQFADSPSSPDCSAVGAAEPKSVCVSRILTSCACVVLARRSPGSGFSWPRSPLHSNDPLPAEAEEDALSFHGGLPETPDLLSSTEVDLMSPFALQLPRSAPALAPTEAGVRFRSLPGTLHTHPLAIAPTEAGLSALFCCVETA